MAPQTFAEALKAARLQAGLSQAALARRAGLTGSYISVLESRRRRPPSPRVVRSLASVLGVEPGPLLEAAALERSPPTVRRRLERLKRERGQVQRTRDRLLTTTLFHLAHRPRVVEPMAAFLDLPPGQQALLRRLLGRIRQVPDLEEAERRSAEILGEASPAQRDALVRVLPRAVAGDEVSSTGSGTLPELVPEVPARTVPVHTDLARRSPPEARMPVAPDAWHEGLFFWRVTGDEAHPRIEVGDLVLVDPGREAQDGDTVAVRYDGREVVGVLRRREGEVHIAFPRPELPPLRIPIRRFRPAGVVVRLVREL